MGSEIKMSSFTELCRMYKMKKIWGERNVYNNGRAYKGCFSQHLYLTIFHKWYKRICRTFYRVINISDNPLDWDTKKVVKRVSNDAKYHFKNYKDWLR